MKTKRTCIKDTWTKPKRGRIKVGGGGVWSGGESGGEMEPIVLEQ